MLKLHCTFAYYVIFLTVQNDHLCSKPKTRHGDQSRRFSNGGSKPEAAASRDYWQFVCVFMNLIIFLFKSSESFMKLYKNEEESCLKLSALYTQMLFIML